MQIGILALQGDYEAHGRMLEHLGVEYIYVRKPQHLYAIDGLILPGGESTTMLKFLLQQNFFDSIKIFASIGKPIFGTCAGAILLANEVINPQQSSLALVDVTIERNAYGRQLASYITHANCDLKKEPLEMIFIRAPRIRRVGLHVKVLIQHNDEAVCVQENNCLLATFHPELTNDTTLHEYFILQCENNFSA